MRACLGTGDSLGGIMTGTSSSSASTRFLTVFEVAAMMRVSKRTVYRLVHDGHLEAAKVRGSFRIPGHALAGSSASSALREPGT
jgi:excisionase family DNA binding protein